MEALERAMNKYLQLNANPKLLLSIIGGVNSHIFLEEEKIKTKLRNCVSKVGG